MDVDRWFTRLNGPIAWILRSPLHSLLSWGLVLITVTGRRSGRRYAIPVGYQRSGDELTVLVSKAPRKQWWRNYLEPAPLEVWLRGRGRRGRARVVPAETPAFRAAIATSLQRVPGLARQLGVSRSRELDTDQWRTLSQQVAVVEITLDP